MEKEVKTSLNDLEWEFENEYADGFVGAIPRYELLKWNTNATIKLKSYSKVVVCLIDSGAAVNCMRGIIPTKYFKKT